MKVKIPPMQAIPLHHRTINGVKRWYYQLPGHPNVLLVTHEMDLSGWEGQTTVALFDHPDSRIVCDVIPAAPTRWRDTALTQCTIKSVARLPRGRATDLITAIEKKKK